MPLPPPATHVVETTGRPGDTLALTFDDGPHPVTTPALLDLLARHDVRAVFFLWGDHVLEHPDLVRRMVDEGHVLGNHTMHHDNMGDWEPADIRADLLRTRDAIETAAPGAPVPWFRAPFGAMGATPEVAAALGMSSLGVTVAAGDWENPQPPADEMLRRLEEGATPGGVVLLHDGGGDRRGTVEAVAGLIPRLLGRGWSFTVPRVPVATA